MATSIDLAVAMPVYSLSNTARRGRRPLSFARLVRGLRFLPLGLLWGLVPGGLHSYQVLWLSEPSPLYHGIELWKFVIFLIIGAAVTCPIATLLFSARLKLGLTSTRWTWEWVITASASSAAGIAILWLIFFVWAFLSMPPSVEELGSALLALLVIPIGLGLLIGFESGAMALVLTPVALLARRLIHRQACVANPAGGATETQP